MKMPRSGKSGLAQATAAFAVMFILSAGLCGINLALFSRFGAVSGPEQPNGRSEIVLFLTDAAFIELLGMVIGIAGLIACLIVFVIKKLSEAFSTTNQKEDQ